MPLEFSKLSATQFETLDREKTVFFFPVGPLEDHGPHLPMGLDLAHATKLSMMAGERLEQEKPGWKAVLMPSLALGVDANTTTLAITVRAHVLRDWLIDSCRSLVRDGFMHFVCFSGNAGPKHLTAVEEAGRILWRSHWYRRRSKKPRLVSASSAMVTARQVLRSPFWPSPPEHGGSADTSVALAMAKSLVDPVYTSLPQVDGSDSALGRLVRRMRRQANGYWGDPAHATAAQGEKMLQDTIDRVFPKLNAVWEGANPRWIFRSWYGILPPNQSFFRAWLLAVAVAGVFFAMVWVNSWLLATG